MSGVSGVVGGGGKWMGGGPSRELPWGGCERRRADAAAVAAPAAARPAVMPDTFFPFLGLGGSSGPSPSEEDEASEDLLPRRACRGWLWRLGCGALTAGCGGSSEARGEEGNDTFSGKLRLRPRLYETSGARNCLAA